VASRTMAKRRINVTFPDTVLDALAGAVPDRERNGFIVRATEAALRRERLRRIVEDLRARPAWADEDHPDLATVDDVGRYVRGIREASMPRTWEGMLGEAGPGGNEPAR